MCTGADGGRSVQGPAPGFGLDGGAGRPGRGAAVRPGGREQVPLCV